MRWDEYRAKIGYLPQDVSFYSDFTGRDYLEYSAVLKGMEKNREKSGSRNWHAASACGTI